MHLIYNTASVVRATFLDANFSASKENFSASMFFIILLKEKWFMILLGKLRESTQKS